MKKEKKSVVVLTTVDLEILSIKILPSVVLATKIKNTKIVCIKNFDHRINSSGWTISPIPNVLFLRPREIVKTNLVDVIASNNRVL